MFFVAALGTIIRGFAALRIAAINDADYRDTTWFSGMLFCPQACPELSRRARP
jgi:hypothetical protein